MTNNTINTAHKENFEFTEFIKNSFPEIKKAYVKLLERSSKGYYIDGMGEIEEDPDVYVEKMSEKLTKQAKKGYLQVDTEKIVLEFENGRKLSFSSSEWGNFSWGKDPKF